MSFLKTISFTILLFIGTTSVNAQCGDELVETAILESGSDALFLKEFIVKLKKGKANRPERVAKFNAFLKDSNNYRFNVVNTKEYDTKVILQLFRKGKYLGSNYDSENQMYNSAFDFNCKHTDTYQILMSFMDGKAGCAAGILSIIVNDSSIIDSTYFSDVLYLGIKNPLYIAYTDEPGCHLNVFSNEAEIEGENGKYTIEPKSLEKISVLAQTIDSLGNIKEEITKVFKVEDLPIPIFSINGNTGGLINKSDILSSSGPDLSINSIHDSEKYKILSFTITKSFSDNLGIKSINDSFTFQQKNFIKELASGSTFYIQNIKVQRPDNKIIELSALSYIIQ